VQPAQAKRKLAQIIAVLANREPSGATQCVGCLPLQRRTFVFHGALALLESRSSFPQLERAGDNIDQDFA
jgi:hypothetical protein